VGPRKHVLDGVEIPMGWGNFGESFGPMKSIGIHSCSVHSKRDYSIVNNGIQ